MPIKGPNTDDVFEKWLNKTSAKDLEKKFKVKNVPFQKGNISVAESVKNVDKYTVFYFQSEKHASPKAEASEEKKTDIKSLEKITFYDFTKSIEYDEYKGKSTVPLYDTLKPVNCEKCKGTGYINCKKCKGERLVACSACKGNGSIRCKDCDGSGSNVIKVTILKNGKEKTKKETKYNCPTCFGTGKIECKKCGGIGKVTCPECKANARYKCDKCKGYGNFYLYSIGSVPFKETSAVVPHLFFKQEVEKDIGYRLSNVISQVKGITIRDLNKMNEKEITAQLGYEMDADAKKQMSTAKKEYERLEKSEFDKPMMPIYIFPVLELDVVTPKGSKFKVFSIGAEDGFTVMDKGF